MNFKSITSALATMALAVTMTSCLGDSTFEQTQSYNINDCFNVVTDIATGDRNVRVSPVYSIDFNLTEGTADVTLNNILLPSSQNPYSFKLENLKFQFDKEGYYVINATNVTPKGNGSQFTFDRFQLRYLDRVRNNGGMERIPVFDIAYTINGAYTVNVLSTRNYYFGTTEITPTGEGASPFTTMETSYEVTLDPQSMKAQMNFKSAKFAQAMPVALNFTLRDLPFTVTPNGYMIEKADATTPYINNDKPNPSYDITNLRFSATPSSTGDLYFSCNPAGMGQFHVNANLKALLITNTPK